MNDDELRDIVENEILDGFYDENLWQKALVDFEGDRDKAKEEYIDWRIAQLKQNETDSTGEFEYNDFHPSRKPVKKRNIFIGIIILVILVILTIVLGILLHDYFN